VSTKLRFDKLKTIEEFADLRLEFMSSFLGSREEAIRRIKIGALTGWIFRLYIIRLKSRGELKKLFLFFRGDSLDKRAHQNM